MGSWHLASFGSLASCSGVLIQSLIHFLTASLAHQKKRGGPLPGSSGVVFGKPKPSRYNLAHVAPTSGKLAGKARNSSGKTSDRNADANRHGGLSDDQ